MTTRLIVGDVRKALATLEDESIHCVVTSPPYWGLRDYGTAAWTGGKPLVCPECNGAKETPESAARDEACPTCSGIGTVSCKHESDQRFYIIQTAASTNGSAEAFSEAGEANAERLKKARWREKGTCIHCGAVYQDSQLGLEPTPEQYVENMVAVFREVRRVLHKDGTLWLNLGDSYAGSMKGMGADGTAYGSAKQRTKRGSVGIGRPDWSAVSGLKPKDLVGIPWRVAFALQADGWWLRSDIIWSKPNPMPESVTDRPTRSHEYMFLLTKSKTYYYDADAVAEPVAASSIQRISQATFDTQTGGEKDYGPDSNRSARKGLENFKKRLDKQSAIGAAQIKGDRSSGFNDRFFSVPPEERSPTRNKRDVWTIATKPFKGAHFATFPPALVEPCILAGTSEGGTVLDPFAGSGTVGMVAKQHGRNSVLIELNADYVPLIKKRLKSVIEPAKPTEAVA